MGPSSAQMLLRLNLKRLKKQVKRGMIKNNDFFSQGDKKLCAAIKFWSHIQVGAYRAIVCFEDI